MIENIVIQSVETGKSSVVSWNVAYGLLLMYITANNDFLKWQAEAVGIDTSHIRIKYLDDSPIEKLLSKEERQYITPNDLYEVSLKRQNLLSRTGYNRWRWRFYRDRCPIRMFMSFRHDPFEITLLTEPLETILKNNK